MCMCALINTGSFLYTLSLQDSLQNKGLGLFFSFPLNVWHAGIYSHIEFVTNDAIPFLISLVDNKYIF